MERCLNVDIHIMYTSNTGHCGIHTYPPVPAPSAPVVMAVPQTNSIQFSWSQEEGDVVESYSLSLVYIGPCSLTVEPFSGSLGGGSRESTARDLLGFSEYEFTINATNSAGMSSAVLHTTTLSSGTFNFTVFFDCRFKYIVLNSLTVYLLKMW